MSRENHLVTFELLDLLERCDDSVAVQMLNLVVLSSFQPP